MSQTDLPAETTQTHFVNGQSLHSPWPQGMQVIGFAMGCFWGAERLFWSLPGVHVTRVGYQGGHQENPNYGQVCQKTTGHAEMVQVVFDPARISLDQLLAVFWEEHDPTQGDAQGNDHGPQYRSMIFANSPAQEQTAKISLQQAQAQLDAMGYGPITTRIKQNTKFWMAEEEHQQYLAKNPGGYCGLSGTGLVCDLPIERDPV